MPVEEIVEGFRNHVVNVIMIGRDGQPVSKWCNPFLTGAKRPDGYCFTPIGCVHVPADLSELL